MAPMKRADKATVRELAVKASCDPRTILKVLRGEAVRGMAGHRARAAVLALDLLPAGPGADAERSGQ